MKPIQRETRLLSASSRRLQLTEGTKLLPQLKLQRPRIELDEPEPQPRCPKCGLVMDAPLGLKI